MLLKTNPLDIKQLIFSLDQLQNLRPFQNLQKNYFINLRDLTYQMSTFILPLLQSELTKVE